MPSRKIADSTVRRLAIYLRVLEALDQPGQETVSSVALAHGAGTTSSQVRKDLSCFGSFGKRGLGYDGGALSAKLREILGLVRRYRVILIGAGRLAGALVKFSGFSDRGFDIVAVVDKDPAKIGRTWESLEIQDVANLEAVVREKRVDIAMLVTPGEAAQGLVDRLVAAGVTAMLSFAPVHLQVPEGVDVKSVNLAIELETLSYSLQHREPL